MLNKIKLQNSTLIIIGSVVIILGFVLGFYEYFQERKSKTFSEMNILLYENEIPENKIETESENEEKIENNKIEESNVENSSENNKVNLNYIGFLEIPKINLKRGFFGLDSEYNNVDKNITIIKGSTMPDTQNNNLILAAHSGNCSYCYFNQLYKLENGDKAYISYNNKNYEYKIVNIYEVEKDGTVAIYRDYSKNVLTLITCTRNSNTKQTVYILELID